jgi:hypothetical protein
MRKYFVLPCSLLLTAASAVAQGESPKAVYEAFEREAPARHNSRFLYKIALRIRPVNLEWLPVNRITRSFF